MFKVKVKTLKNNRKTAKTQVTYDTFKTIDDAKDFINKCIRDQYHLCMRGWGLTLVDTYDLTETDSVALFQSACIAFDCTAMRMDFSIINA